VRGTGRKPGVWRGHEEEAELVRKTASRHPDQWSMIATRVSASKAQQVAWAIKNGKTADFKPDDDGEFTAHARKSEDQENAPLGKNGKPITLYDVWCRYLHREPEPVKTKVRKGA
jgi:hypothetical protein